MRRKHPKCPRGSSNIVNGITNGAKHVLDTVTDTATKVFDGTYLPKMDATYIASLTIGADGLFSNALVEAYILIVAEDGISYLMEPLSSRYI